jgi:hypothetical protein
MNNNLYHEGSIYFIELYFKIPSEWIEHNLLNLRKYFHFSEIKMVSTSDPMWRGIHAKHSVDINSAYDCGKIDTNLGKEIALDIKNRLKEQVFRSLATDITVLTEQLYFNMNNDLCSSCRSNFSAHHFDSTNSKSLDATFEIRHWKREILYQSKEDEIKEFPASILGNFTEIQDMDIQDIFPKLKRVVKLKGFL